MAENTSNTNNTEHTITAEQTNLPAQTDSCNSNKIKFHHLAPEKSENYALYSDAFDNAFKDEQITNIAVTGPYASGKSSIMQACKEQYGENKFITLSLTNFNNNETDLQSNIIIRENKEENLESQLINQLIHKIDNKKIEDSRFLISHKIDSDIEIIKNKIYKNKKLILLLITSIAILSFNGDMFANTINLIEKYFSKYINIIFSIFEAVKLIAIFIIAGIVIKIFPSMLYQVISLIKKNKFRRINLYGNEIELFTSDDTSIFDKHTDEILYLFENAGVNYFIFEDIDRYEDVTVFKKLREINILLNDKRKREKKPLIKFIYLICDNMFTAEERTKFFDFIIPVVPYIHKGNSYDYMVKELFIDEAKDEKNKKFLIKISLFIDNARLLKNIANEYYIYSKFIHLKDREPYTKFIKLLSLIIYKNLFPKDFNLLYFNKGYLAELFNKETFAKKQEKSVEEYKNKTIKECININNRDIFFKAPNGYDYIYNSGYMNLIKFLITDGYIDETYKDYISEISENSLTYEERLFLQNIIAHNGEQYNLSLSQIIEKERLDNLLLFLEKDYFNQIEILNIKFIYSLIYNHYKMHISDNISLEEKNVYNSWIKLIINKIKEHKWYDFLFIYIEHYNYELLYLDLHQTMILNSIYDNYNEIANILSKDDNLYIKFSYFTIKSIILFSDEFKNTTMVIWNSIKTNKDDITKYITTNKRFIELLDYYYSGEDYLFEENDLTKISHNDIYQFINILYKCNFKLNDITEINNIDLFNSILDKQLFIVNINNIMHILKKSNIEINCNYIENILEELLNLSDKKLQKYIFDNFGRFIKTSHSFYRYNINVEKDIYDKILESELITDNHKEIFKQYFQSLE